jgi:CheY-like chemotaxis protein
VSKYSTEDGDRSRQQDGTDITALETPGCKILLVDDEPVVLEVGSEMLTSMGFEVLLASNGAEALEVFRNRVREISLVILDLVMPFMDGWRAFKALKAMDPRVKVLATSGYSDDCEAARMLEMGFSGFLQKPFSMRNLRDALSSILSKSGG